MNARVRSHPAIGLLLASALLIPQQASAQAPGGIAAAKRVSSRQQPARPSPQGSSERKTVYRTSNYGLSPLSFEDNRGQSDPRVAFLSRGRGYSVFLTRGGEAVLALLKPAPHRDRLNPSDLLLESRLQTERRSSQAVLRMKLIGAKTAPQVQSLDELPGKANYLIGKNPENWRTNVSTFAKVKFQSIYPGVDLVYYGNQRQLEHDFIVSPGASASTITIGFEGADRLAVDAGGNLVLGFDGGEVRFERPVIYQEVAGRRTSISGSYALKGSRRVGFHVAAYDRTRPLIIDPVLWYSSYLGGSSQEQGRAIAVDSSGSAYVTGYTLSSDFPTANPVQAAGSGGTDAFVTKLSANGFTLLYSTYLGGSGDDGGLGIAVDSSFCAYVTGYSNSANFPTANAIQSGNGGYYDAFVTKLDPSGSTLAYSTLLGGDGLDIAWAVAVDASSNAVVTGYTCSSNFPTTAGSLQTTHATGSCYDAFVAKINATGSALVYSTYLGGSDMDLAFGVAVDAGSNAYVVGYTCSNDFPTTPGALQTTNAGGGCRDVFVTKLNAAGSALAYSTYIGGNNEDGGFAIAVDPSLNAYITGYTCSADFPIWNAFQDTKHAYCDAFVTKLNAAGSALGYSTYLGGTTGSVGYGIAVDSSLNAYVTGYTSSPDFPTTANAFQNSYAGPSCCDAYITKLTSTGSALVYSSYLGGTEEDVGYGIAVDSSANAYVTGYTCSRNFPTTAAAFQTSNVSWGCYDAFVTRIADAISSTPGRASGTGFIRPRYLTMGFGDKASFSFSVQLNADKTDPTGNLNYDDGRVGVRIKAFAIKFVSIGDGPCGANAHARFAGSANVTGPSGEPATQDFEVNVGDCGESGSSTTAPDRFSIATSGPTPYTATGSVEGGNIQVRVK